MKRMMMMVMMLVLVLVLMRIVSATVVLTVKMIWVLLSRCSGSTCRVPVSCIHTIHSSSYLKYGKKKGSMSHHGRCQQYLIQTHASRRMHILNAKVQRQSMLQESPTNDPLLKCTTLYIDRISTHSDSMQHVLHLTLPHAETPCRGTP